LAYWHQCNVHYVHAIVAENFAVGAW